MPVSGLGLNLAAKAQPDPHGEHHGDHDLHNTSRADAASVPKWATSTTIKGGFLSSRTNVNGGWSFARGNSRKILKTYSETRILIHAPALSFNLQPCQVARATSPSQHASSSNLELMQFPTSHSTEQETRIPTAPSPTSWLVPWVSFLLPPQSRL